MAMTSQEKFRVLADQIKISNQLDKEILEKGELTRIDVSNKNRSWEFQITLPYFLSNEDYLIFTHAIKEVGNNKMFQPFLFMCTYSFS